MIASMVKHVTVQLGSFYEARSMLIKCYFEYDLSGSHLEEE